MVENAKYAGLFRRVLSWIIDIGIPIVPSIIMFGFFYTIDGFFYTIEKLAPFGLLIAYIAMAVPTLICVNDHLFEVAQNMKFKMRFLTLCKYVAFLILGALIIAPVGRFILFSLDLTDLTNLAMAQTLVCIPVLFFIYVPMLESSKYQGTMGQMIMRVKIVDREGNKISFTRSICRLIVFVWTNALGISIINFFTILFTKEKKGLHDMICRTRIVLR